MRLTLEDGFILSNVAFGMAGYGHQYTEMGVRVKGPGVDEYYKDSEQLAIAPVAFMADIDKEEHGAYTMEINFRPSSHGGVYRIQAYGKSFSMGIGGGMGVGYARLRGIRDIQVFFE